MNMNLPLLTAFSLSAVKSAFCPIELVTDRGKSTIAGPLDSVLGTVRESEYEHLCELFIQSPYL